MSERYKRQRVAVRNRRLVFATLKEAKVARHELLGEQYPVDVYESVWPTVELVCYEVELKLSSGRWLAIAKYGFAEPGASFEHLQAMLEEL